MSNSETPAGQTRVARNATLVISAHFAFILMFIAGSGLSIWAFAKNGQTSVNCFGGSVGTCGTHHSYALGVVLLAVGFIGNLLTMAVGARLAIGYGLGAFNHYQPRRFTTSTLNAGQSGARSPEQPTSTSGLPT